ncbi:phage major capsid protein [Weissella cibaria]|uniref:phage major capsid protein n=1 Tax=Weissella cibaria TaxID=137591 RepID=UPI00167FFFDC|nr:phage major capsid protein [Weissella cibaria]MBD1501978.1 phage major capsid protein [Weissella cibaria]
MDIQALNDAWVAAGQHLSDLQNKAALLVNDDAADVDAINSIKNDIEVAKAKRDLAKDNYDRVVEDQAHAVLNDPDAGKKPLNDEEVNIKDKFVKDFVGMMKNDPKVVNLVSSSTDENGNAIGLTIPQDIETAINTLKRQYDSLEQYVNVEKVGTPNGSRVFEKWSDITPLTNLDAEDGEIANNDDPKLSTIKYLIKRYAGITTVTNTLLKDTAENILAWLSSWIAKKVVVTRNTAIIAVMNAAPTKPTLATFDDIKKMALTAVDPAIRATSFFMTNTSGIAVLATVKDADGRYLLQRDVTQPENYMIEGKRVIEIADKWLPSNKGAMPLYFGDLKQAVTLFDRENMSLLSTNIGGGAFEKDLTKLRVIDRFDVKTTDADAFVAGSFTAIADQPAKIVQQAATAGTQA